MDYFINWFPTRPNTNSVPPEDVNYSQSGTVALNLAVPTDNYFSFGGVLNNFTDTLHADYAFVISPQPIVKNLMIDTNENQESLSIRSTWDFGLFPNPVTKDLFLTFEDDSSKDIVINDMSGRKVKSWSGVSSLKWQGTVEGLAAGTYWISVRSSENNRTKKFIVQ